MRYNWAIGVAASLLAATSAAPLSKAKNGMSSNADWSAVDNVLQTAVNNKVFPGCAAGVIDSTGNVVYLKSFGHQTYGVPTPVGNDVPPVTLSTLFDMASVTKILGATTASALLSQWGYMDLNMLVSHPSLLGPVYAANGKGSVRIMDCLLHQAGYPPDPVPSYFSTQFGCPATALSHPPLTFNCSEMIFDSLLAQTLQYPTGTQYIYSDLSMITMQYVIGTIVANNQLVAPSDLLPGCASADPATQPGLYKTCHFEAFVRTKAHHPIGMGSTQFLIPHEDWANAMPTWNDTYYRHEVMQGAVSDENAYALGGIAGHAGVWSNVMDMLTFTGMWAYGPTQTTDQIWPSIINATTQKFFFTSPRPTFSSRAIGWVVQNSLDFYLGCGNFSSSTVYHTGYTGTMLCIDPISKISTVLLTNRVYPNSTGQADTVHTARQMFNNAVLSVLSP